MPQNKKVENAAASNNPSKSALKNKKRREKKKEEDGEIEAAYIPPTPVTATPSSGGQAAKVIDPETAKKLKKLNERLTQIVKLKAMQKEGKKLELNHLDKIKKEQEILDKLKALKISS